MHIVYVDESADEGRTVASGICVPDRVWRDAFDAIRLFRRAIRTRFDVPISYELHARRLVAGHGMPGDRRTPIGREVGITIFLEGIDTLNSLGDLGVYAVNVSLTTRGRKYPLRTTVSRLFQRVENSLIRSGEFGIVVYDGQEGVSRTMARRLLRLMQVYNPVPSRVYPGTYRNLPLRMLLGDPFMRDSKDDVFLQMADFMAYALLRQDNPPQHPLVRTRGVQEAFGRLDRIWLREASRSDTQGVVRE
jgi:hypothetical protein